MVAIARPAFGLPTIIEETEMPNWHLLFSITGPFCWEKTKAPSIIDSIKGADGEGGAFQRVVHTSISPGFLDCLAQSIHAL